MPKSQPNAVDKMVGKRIREQRVSLGLSEDELGTRIDMPGKRVQALEEGRERAGAAVLFKLCAALGVNVSVFFQ